MAEENFANGEDELDYLEEYEYTEEDFDTVRKPLNVAYIRLTELWNSRTAILTRMEEIQNWFYDEVDEHIFLQDMPIVVKFKQFLDLYDDYKIKWEESVEAYNKAFKDVVRVIDEKYILAKHAGKEEREEIQRKIEKIRQLQHDGKVLVQDYEKKMHDMALKKEVFTKKIVNMIEDLADDDGMVDAKLLIEVVTEKAKVPDLKKLARNKIKVKVDSKEVEQLFEEFKSSSDVSRLYAGKVSALKRSKKAGKISQTEYDIRKTNLEKAKSLFDDLQKFSTGAEIEDDYDE